jgi:hypothetical protein
MGTSDLFGGKSSLFCAPKKEKTRGFQCKICFLQAKYDCRFCEIAKLKIFKTH